MEWLAILPGHPIIRIYDPTSARYSVGGMNFWLGYAKNAVDYHIDPTTLKNPNRTKPRFKIERVLWLRQNGLLGGLPPYLQEEQNGSISDREIID